MPFYAKIHFVLVHFPIGLLITATLVEWYQAWRKRVATQTLVWFAAGVVGAWLSVGTGILNRNWQVSRGLLDNEEMQVLAWRHLLLSITATVLFTGCLVLKIKNRTTGVPRWGYVLQAAGLILLILSTHLGGLLAHG